MLPPPGVSPPPCSRNMVKLTVKNYIVIYSSCICVGMHPHAIAHVGSYRTCRPRRFFCGELYGGQRVEQTSRGVESAREGGGWDQAGPEPQDC